MIFGQKLIKIWLCQTCQNKKTPCIYIYICRGNKILSSQKPWPPPPRAVTSFMRWCKLEYGTKQILLFIKHIFCIFCILIWVIYSLHWPNQSLLKIPCTNSCPRYVLMFYFHVQCPPLNRITLGQHKSDNNNRMIQLTDVFYVC